MAKNKKKPRNQFVYFQVKVKEEDNEISVSFNKQTGKIESSGEVRNIYGEITYDRQKGPKVLARVPQSTRGKFEINETIQDDYDIIFAIDTNRRMINGYNVFVSGIIQCQKVIAVNQTGNACKSWQCWRPFCMEFIEVESKSENIGWMLLIDSFIMKHINFSEKRIGIIVDSDLQNLNQYNSRTIPIYGDFILPENIKLIYASRDGGSEFFSNKMLREADKFSNLMLDELQSGRIPFNNKRIEGAPYLGYRRLIPNRK